MIWIGYIVAAFSAGALQDLTVEEMVFASKLSDVNRRRFCYEFSQEERAVCMQELQEDQSNPDHIVSHMMPRRQAEQNSE